MATNRVPDSGNFSIGLKDEAWRRRIVGAIVFRMLDQAGKCSVELAGDGAWLSGINPSDLQDTITVDWQGSRLFQGGLTGFGQSGVNRLTLHYEDSIALLRKSSSDYFLKTNSLASVVEKIGALGKVSFAFTGDFNDPVTAFSLHGKSLLENLRELSDRYGFFFIAEPKGDRIGCIRLGSTVGEKTLDLEKQPYQSEFSVTSEAIYDQLKLKFLDSNTLESSEATVGGAQLYAKTSPFHGHPGFAAKKQWKTGQATLDLHAGNSEDFKLLQTQSAFQVSKSALRQEMVSVSCFMGGIEPGQSMQLSSPIAGGLTAGKYLVLGCRHDFYSSVPKVTFTGVRA